MTNKLPDLVVRHRRIEDPDSSSWILTPLVYKEGAKIYMHNGYSLEELKRLPLKNKEHINVIDNLKLHAEGLLSSGSSTNTVQGTLKKIKRLFGYADAEGRGLDTVDAIRQTLFTFAEYLFIQANLEKIKHDTAYNYVSVCSWFLNGAFEDLKFEIDQTRLKLEKKSRRILGRNAEKVMLNDAAKLASFLFDLSQKFSPSTLTSGSIPILVDVNNQQVNLTPGRKYPIDTDKNFVQTEAYLAFNIRVTAELFIFLAMTIQNQAPTYNLKREKFKYKPLGGKYEVREYKARRGGEVLFKIPKPYKPYFESYLAFLDEYASDSEWLFPYLIKHKGYRKRTCLDTTSFRRLCVQHEIPWVKPSAFRTIGENILLRLSADEQMTADYANHAVATFRQSYEFPSLQRAMIEITHFWDKNDPLSDEAPTLSLFNSPCNGVPVPIDDSTNILPKPDCINPTGCIGCLHYRDEDSLDYVWGLQSFKYLKIIESTSHRTKQLKPSNLAIEWANMKINWFKNSKLPTHKEWAEETEIRIEEGDYHPNWSQKIEKYEG